MKKNNKIFTTREIRKSNFNLKKYFRGSSEMRKYEIFQRKCRLNGNLGLNDFLLLENYDIRGYSIQSRSVISICTCVCFLKDKKLYVSEHGNLNNMFLHLYKSIFIIFYPMVTLKGHFPSSKSCFCRLLTLFLYSV